MPCLLVLFLLLSFFMSSRGLFLLEGEEEEEEASILPDSLLLRFTGFLNVIFPPSPSSSDDCEKRLVDFLVSSLVDTSTKFG